jgi:hypothetical protein
MALYLAVFAGCLIFVLLQLNSVYTLPEFRWLLFFKTNWIPTLLNLIIGEVMVFAKADLVNIYPITFMSAMMLGIGGQALIKKLSNIFDKKVETIVSL